MGEHLQAARDENLWSARVRNQARRQWTADPAGALHAGDAPLGTPRSFENVERARYFEQPWMHDVFGFQRHAGRRVLEIGVGLGTDHVQFARAGARLTGVDLTPRCVELTRQRLDNEGLASDLHVMDAEHLTFPDDSFDAVYSFGVLHHVPCTEAAFAEVRRVLRPGGVFLGGLYSRESFAYARLVLGWTLSGRFLSQDHDAMLAGQEYSQSEAAPLVRLFRKGELQDLLRYARFDDIAIRRRHAGLGRFTRFAPAALELTLGRVGGWYLVFRAR